MAMEYFCCFNSYLNKTRNLSDKELGRLFRALMQYSATGELAQLDGREATAFDFIVDDIDSTKERYAAKCEQNKSNRKRSKEPAAAVDECEQPSTSVDDRQRKSTSDDERTPIKNKNKKPKESISFVSNDTQDIRSAESAAPRTRTKAAKFSAKEYVENYTQDPELRILLLEWLDNRRKQRAPETEGAISKNLEKLPELAEQSRLSMQDYMREVIRRGWQALYPIRDAAPNTPPRRADGRDFDWLTGT